MKLFSAPMQGHTDAAFRHFHASFYGEADAYFTPFVRIERGDFRQRDLRDLRSDLNENHYLIPQIIFNSVEEFDRLVQVIVESGHRSIDLNIGCPFPMQTNHGRGASVIANVELFNAISARIKENPDLSFSLKMRPGLKNNDEWGKIIDTINDTPLAHVTFHPRVATQKYAGDIDFAAFEDFLKVCAHPVVYNGDITTPAQITELMDKYPSLIGIMVGRGLLARPSLFNESLSSEWQRDKRLDTMLRFHNALKDHYAQRLCGESQLIEKMKTFWEFAEPEIGRKIWKAIKKATSMAKYDSAVSMI